MKNLLRIAVERRARDKRFTSDYRELVRATRRATTRLGRDLLREMVRARDGDWVVHMHKPNSRMKAAVVELVMLGCSCLYESPIQGSIELGLGTKTYYVVTELGRDVFRSRVRGNGIAPR